MRKRHKAVCPVLVLVVIVVGSIAIYMSAGPDDVETERAAIQVCDQARASADPRLGASGNADPGHVLENCERQNR